ncbi:MAG TPA: lamin tail domain-containing protein, partial [Desulfuromonadaceae bacterium]|nr:lamin tail domain-containing protein [Desulfuromonadaceae bacterium]
MRAPPFAVVCILLGTLFSADANEPFSKPDITTAADSVVTFNEIMYHPPADNPALEWLELYNQMSVDIDLSGWRIEGGIDFLFPTNTIILANGYLVVASNPAAVQAQAGGVPVFGPFTRRLSDSGETLRIRNNNGRLMDAMIYSNQSPWPTAADGSGGALAKKVKFSASSRPENWRVSARVGGTPGSINFIEDPSAPPPEQQFINRSSPARWLVATNDSLGESWIWPSFDDTNWNQGTAAPGFFEGTNANMTLPVARAYSFEGSFADSSGQGVDAQNNGAEFSTSVPAAVGVGQSAQFDGVSDHIRVPDGVNPIGYTLAAWVQVTEIRPCSLIVRTDNNGPNSTWSHQLRINSAGRFEHYLFDGGLQIVAATNSIVPGVWYHLAATATNGGAMRIYVNGVSSGGSKNIGALWTGGDQWRFGTDSGHTPNFFRGRLDEIGIWNVVLGTNEIAALASGAPPTLLNGYFPFITSVVQPALFQGNSSLFLRIPFVLSANAYYNALTLTARYDDGFVAYLNGTEVARRNAPLALAWNSAAATERDRREVVQPEVIDLSGFAGRLVPGKNLLAVHALNASVSDNDFLIEAALAGREAPLIAGESKVVFNEVAPAGAGSFFIELSNQGHLPAQLSGYRILSSAGSQFQFGPRLFDPAQFLTLDTSTLGFSPASGDKLFLIGPGEIILDAVEVQDRFRDRGTSGGAWLYSQTPSPGVSNTVSLHEEIVINELMYHFPPS